MADSETAQYQVLARKYRPARLSDLVGQEALVRTLANAIDTLEHLLDTAPDAPIPPVSDWTQLLKEDERQKLSQLHHTLLMQRLPGRSPTL